MGIFSKMNDDFNNVMLQEFKMKDLGLMHYFLVEEVHQKKGDILIYQNKYDNDILNKFIMDDCKSVLTPIAHG